MEENLEIAFAEFNKTYKPLLTAMLADDNFDLDDFIKNKKQKQKARLLFFQIFRTGLYAMPYILQYFHSCDEAYLKAVKAGDMNEELYKWAVERDADLYTILKNHMTIFTKFFKNPTYDIPMFTASGLHPDGIMEFNWEYHECVCNS